MRSSETDLTSRPGWLVRQFTDQPHNHWQAGERDNLGGCHWQLALDMRGPSLVKGLSARVYAAYAYQRSRTGQQATRGTRRNSILAWNQVDSGNLRINGGSSVLTYSCIHDPGQGDGTGVIHVDPLFVGRETGNLRLDTGSPAIDRADNFVDIDPFTDGLQFLPLMDFDGYPRIIDGNGDGFAQVDMGAYEYHGGE